MRSNGVKIEPYAHIMWSPKWSENGWLIADMLSLYDILPKICDDLPEILYSEDFSANYKDGVSFVSTSIYNSDTFQYIYKNENLSIIDELPEGTYYLGIVVKEQGEYIESEQDHDEAGYECIYRLIK